MGRTQKVLADTVSKELELPLRIGRRFLQRIHDLIADDLVYTARVELRGLGVFFLTTRPAHKTKHPATGKPVLIPEKKAVEFRTAAAILRRLNPQKAKPRSSVKAKRKAHAA